MHKFEQLYHKRYPKYLITYEMYYYSFAYCTYNIIILKFSCESTLTNAMLTYIPRLAKTNRSDGYKYLWGSWAMK